MVGIARHHGLRVVPLRIDRATLAVDADEAARLAGERTRAIVVAQLFGARPRLAPLRAAADRCGAPLVEDCAQGFAGFPDAGDPAADVTLFSFGTIKTQTALGG